MVIPRRPGAHYHPSRQHLPGRTKRVSSHLCFSVICTKAQKLTGAAGCFHCRFKYLTPRARITPVDLRGTKLERPTVLHLIDSPERTNVIISEIQDTPDWNPVTIYEPIPVRNVFFPLESGRSPSQCSLDSPAVPMHSGAASCSKTYSSLH